MYVGRQKVRYFMMLADIVLIPFLLAINANVSNISNFDPEYLYEVNKTTVVHREPLQTTQLTSTIICHPYPTSLRCLLHDMMFVTTLKYDHFKRDVTEEVAREQFKIKQWFEMKFNNHGLESTLVKNDAEKMIESLIKHIVQQFNFDLTTSELQSGFTIKERTPIGSCMTEYNTDVIYLNEFTNEKADSNFQIKPLFKLTTSEQLVKEKLLHLHIVKNRKHCHYSMKFSDFLNGMEVKKYVHIMEVIDNKLKMFTTMDGQLPFDPWNPSGTPVFTETVSVNLIDIRSQKTISYKESYNWTIHEHYILT